ncbi:MAG: DUF2971 domain-containing protein [Phycisphaerales bacterium]|nr:DUF2971 domain-containing protein [Phycisphaerales bacterium]
MELQSHNLKYLYKYRSAQDAERILTTRTIRCSHPSVFNDLLDGQVNLKIPPMDAELREKLASEYVRLVFLEPPVELREGIGRKLVSLWREFARKMPRAQVEAHIRDAVSQIDPTIEHLERKAGDLLRSAPRGPQMVCLSENATSMPMWYHYADQYKGVVLAFDCQSDPQTSFSGAQQIKYARSIPLVSDADEWVQVSTGQLAQPQNVLERMYLVKADQWEYEKEWRVIANQGPPGSMSDIKLAPNELGGMVIGPKTDTKVADRLIRLARTWNPNCVIWETRLDYSSYGLIQTMRA